MALEFGSALARWAQWPVRTNGRLYPADLIRIGGPALGVQLTFYGT